MNISSKQFSIFFWTISAFSFIVIALRSIFVPFCHDETATFFMFVQSGNYMPFYSNTDANNHVLNSFLSNVCFHLFGSSPFALRIPNLLGFIVLVLAIFKLTKRLNQIGSKVFITLALLFSFHWLSFYSVCRGYGLSMAFLGMGLAFMMDLMDNPSDKKKLLFTILFFQLAISANLILIIVILLLSGLIILIQLTNKKFFNISSILIWLVHFALLYYWLRFSFYLQDKGALYLGSGKSYWNVTFVTLLKLLTGYDNAIVQAIILVLFISTVLLVPIINTKQLFHIKKPPISVWLCFVLCALTLAFYLMRKLLHINYPEDRTGMFFYLLFTLLITFIYDKVKPAVNSIVLGVLSVLFITHYFFNLNFRKHSLGDYEALPNRFYNTLVKEQQKSSERITIGGHRLRELFYGFMNYRHNGFLNPADPVESMHMNADYYIARTYEEKYFKPYYDIIDTEPDWGFLILKRKDKINRVLLHEIKNQIAETEDEEFRTIFIQDDTTSDTRPLLAEIKFDVDEISAPNSIWFVFQITDSAGNMQCYKRYPLYWSGDNINGRKNMCYGLISDNLPVGKKQIACYFWNIKKESFFIKIKYFKLYRLEGEGVKIVAPENQIN